MKKIGYFILVLFLGIILMSCNKTQPKLVYLEQNSTLITNVQNTYSFLFAYIGDIEKIDIMDIDIENKTGVEYEFIIEKYIDENTGKEEYFERGNYRIYGIIFAFDTQETTKFNSFKVVINDDYSEKINLDMQMKYYKQEVSEDLSNTGVSAVSSLMSANFQVKCKKDLTIDSVEAISSTEQKIYVYVDGMIQKKKIYAKADDLIYLELMARDNRIKEQVRVAFKINYTINGIAKSYITEFSDVGSLMFLFYDKIDNL